MTNKISVVEEEVERMKDRTVFDVANWFLSKKSMTSKKLQKLVYYAYAWYLTLMNDSDDELNIKLFNQNPEAWVHGPIFPELYKCYKSYDGDNIPKREDTNFNFNEDTLDVLEQVWEVYGQYTGNQLESISHQEDPWIKARNGCSKYQICQNVIKDFDIYKYYVQMIS